jgi:alpha-glucosidase
MRPIFLEYPLALDLYGDDRDFFFGHDLFVAPVVTETVDAMDVHLPPGEWYDYWTSAQHTAADKISLHPKLDEVPLFVRAGAILPMQPLVQFTDEKPNGPLQLHIYLPHDNVAKNASNDCRGSLYQDDGYSFAYQKGEVLRVNYGCLVSEKSVSVTSSLEKNNFKPWWTSAELTLYGVAAKPVELRVGDDVVGNWRYEEQSHKVTLTVPDAVKNWTIHLSF